MKRLVYVALTLGAIGSTWFLRWLDHPAWIGLTLAVSTGCGSALLLLILFGRRK